MCTSHFNCVIPHLEGFTPGVTYFLTLWFTQKEQAGRMALFFSSTAVCGLFGGLLAFGILHMDGMVCIVYNCDLIFGH
jgi:hypothetical protein